MAATMYVRIILCSENIALSVRAGKFATISRIEEFGSRAILHLPIPTIRVVPPHESSNLGTEEIAKMESQTRTLPLNLEAFCVPLANREGCAIDKGTTLVGSRPVK